MTDKEPPKALTQDQLDLLSLYEELTEAERESLRCFLRSIVDSRLVEPPPPKR